MRFSSQLMKRDPARTGLDISGTTGVWVNRTPAGMNLTAGYSQTVSGNTDDNYGVQDVVFHPTQRNRGWAFVCYQGCWETEDYGDNWTKVSGSSVLDTGKNWSSAISKDGDYLLNCSGNNLSTSGAGGSAQVNQTVQYSTDGGRTWTKTASLGNSVGFEIYCVRASPYDNLRAIACSKASPSRFFESLDGGRTWTDHGDFSASLASAYVTYVHNSDTVIMTGQDGGNTYRLTKSGGAWSATQITDLNSAGHYHGMHEPVYDPVQGYLWFPSSGGGTGTNGVWRSTNNAVNFTRIDTTDADVLAKTGTRLYSMFGAPLNGGTHDSKFMYATLNPGNSFNTAVNPNALYSMANGPKRIAITTDGNRYKLIAGAWHAGLWAYIEG